MRTAKILMDAGFSFASANSVVSQHALWTRLQHDEAPTDRFLLLWPPYGDFILFDPTDLHLLPERLKENGVVTLINLGDVQRHVASELSAIHGGLAPAKVA
jgi:hypothetical protein